MLMSKIKSCQMTQYNLCQLLIVDYTVITRLMTGGHSYLVRVPFSPLLIGGLPSKFPEIALLSWYSDIPIGLLK